MDDAQMSALSSVGVQEVNHLAGQSAEEIYEILIAGTSVELPPEHYEAAMARLLIVGALRLAFKAGASAGIDAFARARNALAEELKGPS